jgi:hypothetical protein
LLLPAERHSRGVKLRFLVSFAHGTDRRTIKRFRKLSGHHHPKRLQSCRGPRNFAADAHGMDGGPRRANERTSGKDFGVLKRRKQSRIRFAPLVRRNDIITLPLRPGRFAIRTNPLKFTSHLPNLALCLPTRRATPRLGNPRASSQIGLLKAWAVERESARKKSQSPNSAPARLDKWVAKSGRQSTVVSLCPPVAEERVFRIIPAHR